MMSVIHVPQSHCSIAPREGTFTKSCIKKPTSWDKTRYVWFSHKQRRTYTMYVVCVFLRQVNIMAVDDEDASRLWNTCLKISWKWGCTTHCNNVRIVAYVSVSVLSTLPYLDKFSDGPNSGQKFSCLSFPWPGSLKFAKLLDFDSNCALTW